MVFLIRNTSSTAISYLFQIEDSGMTDAHFRELAPSIKSLEAFTSLTIRTSNLTDDSAQVLASIMLKHRLRFTHISVNGGFQQKEIILRTDLKLIFCNRCKFYEFATASIGTSHMFLLKVNDHPSHVKKDHRS